MNQTESLCAVLRTLQATTPVMTESLHGLKHATQLTEGHRVERWESTSLEPGRIPIESQVHHILAMTT